MQEDIGTLVASLMEAKDFEQAALSSLRPLMRIAEEAIASRYGRRGRILRGVVHVRPNDTYRQLIVLEQEAVREGVLPATSGPAVSASFFASASVWRTVVHHRQPVYIDVNLGTLQPGGSARLGEERQEGFATPESQQRLLGRHASHICVLPLRTQGGAVEGMICIEVDCMAAVGQPFIWEDISERLQLLVDVAAPYLLGLPRRLTVAAEVNEFLPVVGRSMSSLISILRVFAQQDETILISGPTGAGKTRLARWCHEQSTRREGPFERLDLMTIPDDLQMAELFGWRKGAFSGAIRDNSGSVARAEKGTLFIDEIDKLSLKAQAGLLHILEERCYRSLGDNGGEQFADVRFIVGTNAHLRSAVKAGQFREDLYFRINVLPVQLPPLDDRKDEITLWAQYMLNRQHRARSDQGQADLTPAAGRLLEEHSWPGNLRHLDNIIRRAYALVRAETGGAAGDVVLEPKHIQRALAYEGERPPSHSSLVEGLRRAASDFIQQAQKIEGGLDLDLTDAFKGFVLGTAVQQLGREEAFRLMKRAGLLRNRNHYKALQREMEKVDALLQALQETTSPFADLSGEEAHGA